MSATENKVSPRKRSKRYDAKTRDAHLKAWRSSGKTRRTYCAAHGISGSTFYRWLKLGSIEREGKVESVKKRADFVRISGSAVKSTLSHYPAQITLPSGVTFHLSDFPLEDFILKLLGGV